MSNGSFITSQLPITTNCASSDRFLILWNAISNGSIGSGTPQTMMMALSDIVNNSMNLISTGIANSGSISVGNSTYNTTINSTSIVVSNGTTVFSVNTAGVINGNGVGLTSINAAGSNTNILFNNSGIIAGASNLTWNGSSISVGNSGTNTTVNSSVFLNGQTYINSTTLSVGNNGTVLVGNATYNTVISPQSISISNNGVTVWTVTGQGCSTLVGNVTVGNSTSNASITQTVISVGNATVNSALTPTYFTSGNSTVFTTVNSSSIAVGVINGGVGTLMTNSAISTGNSTVNTTTNSTHYFAGNSTVYGFSNSTVEGIVGTTSNATQNSSAEVFSNSTGNNTSTPTFITLQTNTTSNSIFSNSSIIFNGNSSINLAINTTAVAYNGISSRPILTVVLNDTATVANANTVAVNTFPAGAQTATLAAATTYLMDGVLFIANAVGAFARQIQVAFGNSAAIGSIAYETVGMVVNSSVNASIISFGLSNAATIVTPTSGATGVSNAFITIKGAIVTVGAVNITPQFLYSGGACGNTPVMKAGSYFVFTPVQNSSVGTVGTWS